MTDAFQPNLDFTAAEQVDEREAFVVDLDGYEGPLHVLLALARTQKVDLLKLSITRLAEQYLAFVHEARRRNFSLAADYLVMASWLAYLKSRLLLPRTEKGKGDEMPAEEMAAAFKSPLKDSLTFPILTGSVSVVSDATVHAVSLRDGGPTRCWRVTDWPSS